MRVKLTNFLCWDSREFEFSHGVNMLSGVSGAGKSSIVTAIAFAVTGKGRKLVMHGKSGCRVDVTMPNGDKITRTKGPVTVKVCTSDGRVLEKDEAEAYLSKSYSQFSDTSILAQKGVGAFLSATPSVRSKYTMRLNFGDYDLKGSTDTLREAIRDLKRKCSELEGKLSGYKEMEPPVDKTPPSPVPGVKKYAAETKVVKGEIVKLRSEIKSVQLEITQLRERIKHVDRVQRLEDELASLVEPAAVEKPSSGDLDKNISEIEGEIEYIRMAKEYHTLHAQLESYNSDMTHLTSQLRPTLLQTAKKEVDKIDALESLESEYERVENLLHISQTKHDLITDIPDEVDVDSMIATLAEGEATKKALATAVTCPACSHVFSRSGGSINSEMSKDEMNRLSVSIKNGKSSNQHRSSEISRMNQLLSQIKSYKFQLSVIKEKIEQSESCCMSRDEANAIITRELDIETRVRVMKMNKDHKVRSERCRVIMAELGGVPSNDLPSIEDSIEELGTMRQMKRDYQVAMKLYSNYRDAHSRYVKRRDDIIKQIEESSNINQEKEHLIELEATLSSLQAKDKATVAYHTAVRRYAVYLQNFRKWTEWNRTVSDLETKLASNARLLGEHQAVLDAFQSAQQICLEEFYRRINARMRTYLSEFFEDGAVQLRIQANEIELYHSGVEINLSSLSGGERDRVELAWMCSVADEVGTPVLILDESLSSLDGDSSERIVQSVRRNTAAKTVIVVSHQIQSGLFDNEVAVGRLN